MPAPGYDPFPPRTLGCLGVGCTLVAAFAFWVCVQNRGFMIEMKDWPRAEGVVTRIDRHVSPSRDPDEPDEEEYVAIVTYTVGDATYTTSRKIAADDYRPGQSVRIRYSPLQPSYARVEGDVEARYRTHLAFGAVFSCAAAALLAAARWRVLRGRIPPDRP